MIRRLNYKDAINIYEFILRCQDKFEDFYITQNKARKFFTDLNLIKKILKYQEVYAVEEKEITALLLIYREKGFRPYIKILCERKDLIYDLLKFLVWNFSQYEFYAKYKKENPITKIAQLTTKTGFSKYGFKFCGSRGQEILLIHQKQEKRDDQYTRKITQSDTR